MQMLIHHFNNRSFLIENLVKMIVKSFNTGDNIKEWTGIDFVSSAKDWTIKVEGDCCKVICGTQTTLIGYGID